MSGMPQMQKCRTGAYALSLFQQRRPNQNARFKLSATVNRIQLSLINPRQVVTAIEYEVEAFLKIVRKSVGCFRKILCFVRR
jgi:hypothetical protein